MCQAVGGGCTLRAALQTATTHAGCDRIVLGTGTYRVTRPRTTAPTSLAQRAQDQWRYRGIDGALTLLTTEGDDTIIDGAPGGGTIVEANGTNDRVFQVSTQSIPSAQTLATRGLIQLRNLTFRGGNTVDPCGGVELSTCFDDPIGPRNTTLVDRTSCRYPHDVHLSNVIIENNTTTQSAGGLCMRPTAYDQWNYLQAGFAGNVVLMNVTIRNNHAGTNAGGLEYADWGGCSALVVGQGGLTLEGNEANQNGGGLLTSTANVLPAWRPGASDVASCPSTPNGSLSRGAPPFRPGVDVLRFTNNRARSGGGLYFTAWSLHLGFAVFEGNVASENGGGLASQSSTFLYQSSFRGNRAGQKGGGAWFENQTGHSAQLEGVVFLDNTAGREGGGVWLANNPPQPTGYLAGLVIARNHAGERGGGIFVSTSLSTIAVTRATFLENEVVSSTGQGDNVYDENAVGRLAFKSSAFAQRATDPRAAR